MCHTFGYITACNCWLKKLTAILFIALFLFNLFGYKAWFYYLQIKSTEQLQASLDKNEYSDQDLVTIKVPLSLPYVTNWSAFEQYDGSIEVDGQHYNYVKRKVSNDTLILLCVPNHEQNRLNNSQNDYEKLVNNGQLSLPNNKTGNTSLLVKSLITGYRQENISYEFSASCFTLQVYKPLNDTSFCDRFIASPWQPPDITCWLFILNSKSCNYLCMYCCAGILSLTGYKV